MTEHDPLTHAYTAGWRAWATTDGDDDTRLRAAFDALCAALTETGLLTPAQPAKPSPEDAARELAAASASPRYTDPGGPGWQALLESRHNIDHAYRQAAAQPPAGDPKTAARLRTLRDVLVRNAPL